MYLPNYQGTTDLEAQPSSLRAACKGRILLGFAAQESGSHARQYQHLPNGDRFAARKRQETPAMPVSASMQNAQYRPISMTFRPLPAKATAALLREARSLHSLLDEAQRLSRLQQLLDELLEPIAREHCRIAVWKEGKLLLIVSDGHWATRLRYQEKRLLRQLQSQAEFSGLQRITIKVRPPAAPAQAAGHQPSLSPNAARAIQDSAEAISDPKLRAALERLASHAKPAE